MKEFNKYELHRIKAQAIESVGQSVQYSIDRVQEELNDMKDSLSTYMISNDADDSDWYVQSRQADIKECEARLDLWLRLEKALDKELG